jgi:serine phosphatase RsbU (regulator of sigma subunit)
MTPRATTAALYGLGLAAFLLAGLSIVDMYLPRPYDGVVLEGDALGEIKVRAVVAGSGADRAGIRAGDRIVGIGRSLLRSPAHAAELLNRRETGETVAYFVRRPGGEWFDAPVQLGRRQIGDTSYLSACLLGFSFFFIGLFVLRQRPDLPASRVLFWVCTLFLLVLVCRLRPASYSRIDSFVLHTGTAALVLLPASFLHFFLIFPRPVWDGHWGRRLGALARPRARRILVAGLYFAPVAVLAAAIGLRLSEGEPPALVSGAPAANWWLMALFTVAGLAVLAANARRLASERERRGAMAVLAGSTLGLLPILTLAVGFPELLEREGWFLVGVLPMALIPLSFAWAIVRYQLLNVRLILRRSLLYTVTTALVTGLYALGIASVNGLFRGAGIAESRYFPLLFALTILLLFEPLRRQVQVPVDRFFFAERLRLQRAMVDLGRQLSARLDPGAVVRDLVEELPQLLGLRFAALYLFRGGTFERAAGPPDLPEGLELPGEIFRRLSGRTALARLDELDEPRRPDPDAARLLAELAAAGVEVMGSLATSRRRIGVVLLSSRHGQTVPLEQEELGLLQGLLDQAAIALETSLLLDERARQAELERELEIAAAIQLSLLPDQIELGPGWRVAASCRPARHVGGDFYSVIAGPAPGQKALVYGDVAGKSVPGALMMMMAKELLHSLALSHGEPGELFDLANRRLYDLHQRGFVALGYLAPIENGRLRYLIAGQPRPLKRTAGGRIEPLPLADHRLPVGALAAGGYRALDAEIGPGELLVLYSDGVDEARSPAGEEFGVERLSAVIAAAPADADAVVAAVLAALEEFTRGQEPYDDLTLLAIQRLPNVSDGGGVR